MKKFKFLILCICVLGAGFYYGSRPNTYAYKFFTSSADRFPANDSARSIQKIWDQGKLKPISEGSDFGIAYSPIAKPEANICDFYEEVKTFTVYALADVVVYTDTEEDASDSKVRMSAEINCDVGGPSPIFLKSLCSQSLSFYKKEQTFFNTKFNFENILDGFPKSWYIESVEAAFRDGNSLVGIKPSQSDVKAFGKYTIECSSF